MKMKMKQILLYIFILLLPLMTFTEVDILDNKITFLVKGIISSLIIIYSAVNILKTKFKYRKLFIIYMCLLFFITGINVFMNKATFYQSLIDNLLLCSYPFVLISAILSIKVLNKKKTLDMMLISSLVYLIMTFIFHYLKIDVSNWLLSLHTITLLITSIVCIYFYKVPKWYNFIFIIILSLGSCFLSMFSIPIIVIFFLLVQILYDRIQHKKISIKKIILLIVNVLLILISVLGLDNKILFIVPKLNYITLTINLFIIVPLVLVFITKYRKLKHFIKNGYETFAFYIIIILGILVSLINNNLNINELIILCLIVSISIEYIEKPIISKKIANKVNILLLGDITDEIINLTSFLRSNLYEVVIYTNKEKEIDNTQIIDKPKKIIKLFNKEDAGFVIAFDKKSYKLLKKIQNNHLIKIYRTDEEKFKRYQDADYIVNSNYYEKENLYYIPKVINKNINIESPLTNKNILCYCNNYRRFLQLVIMYNQLNQEWNLTIFSSNKKIKKCLNKNNIKQFETLTDRLTDYSLFIMLDNDKYINDYLPTILLNGLPCILYNEHKLMKNEENSYIVNNNKEMIDKANILIESIDKRKVFGKNSIRIAKEYSEQIIYPMWLELFEKIEDNIMKNNKRKK